MTHDFDVMPEKAVLSPETLRKVAADLHDLSSSDFGWGELAMKAVEEHADAWASEVARRKALCRLVMREWTDLDEHELDQAIADEIEAERTTGTKSALAASEEP